MTKHVDGKVLKGLERKFKQYEKGVAILGGRFHAFWVSRVWNDVIRPIVTLLLLVRFSLLVAVVCGLVLIVNDQAQEVLKSLAETEGLQQEIWFVVAAVICAVVAWYWARVAYFFSFNGDEPSDPSRHVVLREYLPRALGVTVFLVIAVAFFIASRGYESRLAEPRQHLTIMAAVFLTFGIGFFFSAPILRKIFKLNNEDRPDDPDFIRHLPRKTWYFLLLGLLLSIGLTVAFANWPVAVAPVMGTGAVVLLFAAALISTGTFLVLYFGTRYRLPVIGFILVWLVGLSFFVDNHRVRQNPEMRSYEDFKPYATGRKSLEDVASLEGYFADWIKELEALHRDDPSIPVFIVAAEGGGIRAAYWTAMVLGALQDRSAALSRGDFARHVFAISGVSGGSLGAATVAALLAAEARGEKPRLGDGCVETARVGLGSVRQRAHRILAHDFLSPTVAVMLFPDFLQRFFPPAMLDDRAMALENSWESAWRECEQGDRFAEPFEMLWAGPAYRRVPLLFLNSTVVDTGQRLITSPILFCPDEFQRTFSDALETIHLLGHDVPLSTAVHTSARFTYVSPAGTVLRLDQGTKTDCGEHATEPDEGQRWIRVVDGGYFENSGAVTANEILHKLEEAAQRRLTEQDNKSGSAKPIRPMVVHISNDPIEQPKVGWLMEYSRGAFLAEALSPVEALLKVRPARGYQARTALAGQVLTSGDQVEGRRSNAGDAIHRPGSHFHFRLCGYNVPLPLGWMLSEDAQAEMRAQLSHALGDDFRQEPRAIAQYHESLMNRIMGILRGEADVPIEERLQVERYEDCESPSPQVSTAELQTGRNPLADELF